MENFVLYTIIGITVIFSYQGFNNSELYNRYSFYIDGILRWNQKDRMLSSGFLHADYLHLGMNMYVLYMFAEQILLLFNPVVFLGLYFLALLGGSALALFIHKEHGDYRAIGASGAVSGIVFASIILFPKGEMGLILIPGTIPSWIFGLLYIGYTIFGIRSQRGRIGHEAHLGGALVGLIAMTLFMEFSPQYAELSRDYVGFDGVNYLYFGLMMAPSLVFLYLIVYHPEWMLTGKIDWSNSPVKKWFSGAKGNSDYVRYKKVNDATSRKAELNELLDKVNTGGLDSLTSSERKRLDELSR